MLLTIFFLLAGGSAGQRRPEILVAAAADLAKLQEALGKAFAEASGVRVRFTMGSSGRLARQIENGAPYDVYLSANERFVKELAGAGRLVPGTVRGYAEGRIALWSRGGKIREAAGLAGREVLHVAIANPTHAPYGVAAKEALERLGLWKAVAGKMVYAENVRQSLEYAESGNAEAAITAWSLVFDKGGILLPAEWHTPIRQAGGVVATSKNQANAIRFMNFLTGMQGRALLERYGLFPPK